MSAMRTVLCAIVATGLALGGALPADAAQLHDVNMDAVTQVRSISGTDGAENTMPGNPEAELPDTIAQSIPDDAEVVSEDHALTVDGTLKDLATGKTIIDSNLVGTQSSQPDPLAKTDGASFIPVEVDAVRTKIENASKAQSDASLSAETARSKATVRLASLPNNEYGAYWGTYNGTPAFFESNGNLFVQQAKGVIDVSEWQGDIDWAKAKSAGVEGAIIRISYGWGNGYDKKALRNISECKRLGIPFGIYMYSYAENSGNAASEGADVASLLRKAGVNPNDLQYPVYYDLEAWSWTGHAHPTSSAVYDGIVNAWFSQLRNAGYSNLAVYSYTSYLNNELNSSSIHAKTRWVAQYGSRMGYTAWSSNDRGWQYSSSAHINGISGSVDVNAFGNRNVVSPSKSGSVYRVYNLSRHVHHYTKNYSEMQTLTSGGWRYEGVAFETTANGHAVYRLYNPKDGNHLFTCNGREKQKVLSSGWRDEGIAWYVREGASTPVYRSYNPNSRDHVYTASRSERDAISRASWRQEGVAWYAKG